MQSRLRRARGAGEHVVHPDQEAPAGDHPDGDERPDQDSQDEEGQQLARSGLILLLRCASAPLRPWTIYGARPVRQDGTVLHAAPEHTWPMLNGRDTLFAC